MAEGGGSEDESEGGSKGRSDEGVMAEAGVEVRMKAMVEAERA